MKMKQKIGAGALLAIIAIGGVYGVGSVQAAKSSTSNSTQKQVIGIEMAEQKALAVAKGQVESIELKKKNNQVYYEVEIDQGQKDVDVLIEAYTGKSLGVRNDNDDDDDDDYKYTDATSTVSDSTIGVSKASAVAVNYLKGTVIEVDLDRDDGRLVYEVELKTTEGTAEVKVDAKTAEIISVEKDSDDHDDHDDNDHDDDKNDD
ncbi:PepSY domain-containing protein [Paenibacillus sp. FA6]|uniref:PepSY domain-containing protein n=1 Tax=Paenibacillus sp. FA6 TaxID=3413029 RepID=UPI003F6586E5